MDVYRASQGGVRRLQVRVRALEVIRLRDFSRNSVLKKFPVGQGVHNAASVGGAWLLSQTVEKLVIIVRKQHGIARHAVTRVLSCVARQASGLVTTLKDSKGTKLLLQMKGKPKLARCMIKPENFVTCTRSRSCEAASAGGSAWTKLGKLKSLAKCH
jgi:hypothetical protein